MKFIARTTRPTNEKYYLNINRGGLNPCIRVVGDSVLPNCTGYAWGRFYEESGIKPNLPTNNAEDWYHASDGYERGSIPRLGSVICYRSGIAGISSDGVGHVAIVEKIYADGSILISQSGYKNPKYWWTSHLNSNYYLPNLIFQGFIYPQVSFEDNQNNANFLGERGYLKYGDQGPNIGKIAAFMYRDFPAYTSKLALGNYYGKYLTKSIKEFQKRTGLVSDGCIGPITLAKLKIYGFVE